MIKRCARCHKTNALLNSKDEEIQFIKIREDEYCRDCAQSIFDNEAQDILVTTTNSFEGYRIKQYLDVIFVEYEDVRISFDEISTDVSDMMEPARLTVYQKRVKKAKNAGMKRLKFLAYQMSGDGVVGIDVDHTLMPREEIGVVISGTVVKLQKMDAG